MLNNTQNMGAYHLQKIRFDTTSCRGFLNEQIKQSLIDASNTAGVTGLHALVAQLGIRQDVSDAGGEVPCLVRQLQLGEGSCRLGDYRSTVGLDAHPRWAVSDVTQQSSL